MHFEKNQMNSIWYKTILNRLIRRNYYHDFKILYFFHILNTIFVGNFILFYNIKIRKFNIVQTFALSHMTLY